MIKLVSKNNGKNFTAYLPDGKIMEAVKDRGRYFLAKLENNKLVRQGEHLKKSDFILIE